MFRGLKKPFIIFLMIFVIIPTSLFAEGDESWKEDPHTFERRMEEDIHISISEDGKLLKIDTKHDIDSLVFKRDGKVYLKTESIAVGKHEIKMDEDFDGDKTSHISIFLYNQYYSPLYEIEGSDNRLDYKVMFNVNRHLVPVQRFEYKFYIGDKLIADYGEIHDIYMSASARLMSGDGKALEGDVVRLEISEQDYSFPMNFEIRVRGASGETEVVKAKEPGIYEFTVDGPMQVLLYEERFEERDAKIRESAKKGVILDPHTLEEIDVGSPNETPEEIPETPETEAPEASKGNIGTIILVSGVVIAVALGGVYIYKKRSK